MLYHSQLDWFQFLEDVSSLLQEALSALTDWRGAAGFLTLCGSVLTETWAHLDQVTSMTRGSTTQVPLTTLKLRVSLTTLSGHSHTEFKTCNSPPVSQNWRSLLDGRRRPVSYDTALRFTFINSQQRVMSDCFILTHYTLFWQSVSPSSAHQQHSHTKIASVQNVTTVMSSALVRWSVWSQVYIYIYLNYCKYLNQIIKDTMYPLPRGLMWSLSEMTLLSEQHRVF